MRFPTPFIRAIAVLSSCAVACPGSATVIPITPLHDNTLFQATVGEQSGGAGTALYSGKLGSNGGDLLRRALFVFNIAGSVPAGATITDVSLQVHVSKASPGFPSENYTLHAMAANWGEGTSVSVGGHGGTPTTNDATWIHPFFGSAATWSTPGGDFSSTVSAMQTMTGFGFYTFSGPQLTADVQNWYNASSSNFGWILIGDEAGSQDAKQFDSRDSSIPNRPTLFVTYAIPEPGSIAIVASVGLATLIRRRRALGRTAVA